MQEIKQFLLDDFNIITLVGTILTLSGLIIGVRRHKRKRLAFEIISNTPLLSVNSEVKDRVKIYLDDRPVTDVNLMMVKLTNTGNESIPSKDFETPITINFGKSATLISFEIFERTPAEMPLPENITSANNWVTLSPFLLNEKDSITIKALVSGVTGAPAITARIAGVKTIEHTQRDGRLHSPFVGTLLFGALTLINLFLLVALRVNLRFLF